MCRVYLAFSEFMSVSHSLSISLSSRQWTTRRLHDCEWDKSHGIADQWIATRIQRLCTINLNLSLNCPSICVLCVQNVRTLECFAHFRPSQPAGHILKQYLHTFYGYFVGCVCCFFLLRFAIHSKGNLANHPGQIGWFECQWRFWMCSLRRVSNVRNAITSGNIQTYP